MSRVAGSKSRAAMVSTATGARRSCKAIERRAAAHGLEQGRVARGHLVAAWMRRAGLEAERGQHPRVAVVRGIGVEQEAQYEAGLAVEECNDARAPRPLGGI